MTERWEHESDYECSRLKRRFGVAAPLLFFAFLFVVYLFLFVVPRLMLLPLSSKRMECILRAEQISQATIAYQADWGLPIDTEQGLAALTKENQGRGPYIFEKSLKDAWGNPFRYEATSQGPKITSAGKDEEFGTKDDLVVIQGREVSGSGEYSE